MYICKPHSINNSGLMKREARTGQRQHLWSGTASAVEYSNTFLVAANQLNVYKQCRHSLSVCETLKLKINCMNCKMQRKHHKLLEPGGAI